MITNMSFFRYFYVGFGKSCIKNLHIKNFESYFDPQITLARIFSLRGVPSSIFINKNGEEFARIIGFIDFDNKKFIDWLKNYN